MDLKTLDLDGLEQQLDSGMQIAKVAADLEMLKRDWLSKEGPLRSLLKQLGQLDPSVRPQVAARLNGMRERLEAFIEESTKRFEVAARESAISNEFIDLSLPGKNLGLGRVHPITLMERRINALLKPFGLRTVQGPEVETEYFCFDALNTPIHHPARDMQDTFYLSNDRILRTQTTSVQARELQKKELPVKVASFGRVFRNETEDHSHQVMFHQFELVWLEEGLTLSNLMALITHVLKGLYGKRRKVRFVPKFYPYTDPSIGPQIDCALCRGEGCAPCNGAGWVTIAGAGMIHRNVLLEFGYDPEKVSGFAFGLGTSRLATQFFGVPTMRTVYDNDFRRIQEGA